MMILLPIHRRYLDRICAGEKLFEFRKRVPVGLKRGDELAIYCTKPTCSIVAYAEIGGVLEDSPARLWERTSFAAGIEEQAFKSYFGKAQKAYGIIISKIHELKRPISMAALRGRSFAPQSFIYLTDVQAEKVKANAGKTDNHGVAMFIGGVHGVGKTTICKASLDPLGFDCISASELIRRHVTMHKTDKRVRNVGKNQDVLVAESNKEKLKSLLYGLDGHYCLLNKDGAIERLPVEVFDSLGFDLLALVDSTVDAVVKHLQARDGTKWSKKTVAALMSAERTHAKRIAKALNKPLVVLDAQKENGAEVIVSALTEVLSVRRTVSRYDDPKLR